MQVGSHCPSPSASFPLCQFQSCLVKYELKKTLVAWSRNDWWAFVEGGSIPAASCWSTNCLVCWRKMMMFGIAWEKHYHLKYFPGMCSSHAWTFHCSHWAKWVLFILWIWGFCLFCFCFVLIFFVLFFFFFIHKGSRNIKEMTHPKSVINCVTTQTNSDFLYHKVAQCSLNHSSTLRWEQGARLFCNEQIPMQEGDCEMKFWKGYRDHSKYRFEELIMFAVDPAKKQMVERSRS